MLLLTQHLVYSRLPDAPKEYVQDRMMVEQETVAEMLSDAKTHIYICGLRGMEVGVCLSDVCDAESEEALPCVTNPYTVEDEH